MALEGSKSTGLRGSEIKAHVMSHLDEGNNLTHVIEAHIAACAQAMDNLLHPGGAALGIGRNEEIARFGLVGQAVLDAFSKERRSGLLPCQPFG
jgi:hypothetical protein